jgi:hypothetical protein
MSATGNEAAERLSSSEFPQDPYAWSLDGKLLGFHVLHPTNGYDIWILRMDEEQKSYALLDSEYNEAQPSFSPDGRWFAYYSNQSGKYEIYVRPLSGSGGVQQISKDGGFYPFWGQRGELFYRKGNKIMAVDVSTTPSFKASNPRELFETRFASEVRQAYSVTPDGKRFLVIKSIESQSESQQEINIVLNWFEELKQSVPVD